MFAPDHGPYFPGTHCVQLEPEPSLPKILLLYVPLLHSLQIGIILGVGIDVGGLVNITVLGINILEKVPLALENAFDTMFTELLQETWNSDIYVPEKAKEPIDCTFDGKLKIPVRPAVPVAVEETLKALDPIEISDDGETMPSILCNLSVPENA